MGIIPFEKLEAFFEEYLNKNGWVAEAAILPLVDVSRGWSAV